MTGSNTASNPAKRSAVSSSAFVKRYGASSSPTHPVYHAAPTAVRPILGAVQQPRTATYVRLAKVTLLSAWTVIA